MFGSLVFSILAKLCSHCYYLFLKHFLFSHKETRYPLAFSTVPSHPSPWQPLIFLSLWIYLFQTFHVDGVIQLVAFCDQLFPLHTVFLYFCWHWVFAVCRLSWQAGATLGCSASASCGGFSRSRAQTLGAWAFIALWHVESSQTRNWTRVPCIGRCIPIHCTTKEVQHRVFKAHPCCKTGTLLPELSRNSDLVRCWC